MMKKGKKNKRLFFEILNWLAIPIGVIPFFSGSRFLFSSILSLFLLWILFWLIIFSYCFCRDCRKYLKKKNHLIIQCENEKSEYYYEFTKLKRITRKIFFKRYFYELGKKLIPFVVMANIVCYSDVDNAKAYFHNLKAIFGLEEQNEDSNKQMKKNSDSTEEKQKEDVTSGQQEAEKNYSNRRFVLDDKEESEFENLERERKVFFYDMDEEDIWEDYVQGSMKAIYDEKRKGVDYNLIRDENGKSILTYIELEIEFKEKVEEASDCQSYDDWVKIAPHSKELDYYIFGLEHLNQIEYEGEKGCFKIWKQLANHYQYYAQEYTRQTDNELAISYYYVNSIYCCMQGLEYSESEGEKEKLYHYMVMRYHDMADEQSKVSDKDRRRASKIYSLLVKKDRLAALN